ncbi:hypothetical protein A2U01_0097840, partial [Trifolium medium]|nr:hypothetical protein [Trifolium medium]
MGVRVKCNRIPLINAKICTTSGARAPRHLPCATRRYPLQPSQLEFRNGASRKPILRDAQL